jgi:DNA helicase-2/ATP-dependent DNA helicase PcrA
MPELGNRGRAAVTAFWKIMERLLEEPQDLLKPLIELVIAETGYAASLTGDDARERQENLGELVTLGANFDRDASAAPPDDPAVPRGLEGFLQTVSLSSDQDGYDEAVDRVPLMTLHAAKGLEFPAVFITGCEEGLLPHQRSMEDRGDIEEERRLFFVGMTRARKYLVLTFARFRRVRGTMMRQTRSPFLAEIPDATIQALDEVTGTTPAPTSSGRGYTSPGPERVVKPEVDALTGLAAGEVVRHPTYGQGRVMAFTTQGGNRMVRIRFNTVGEKLLDPRYARLDKVAPA